MPIELLYGENSLSRQKLIWFSLENFLNGFKLFFVLLDFNSLSADTNKSLDVCANKYTCLEKK